MYIHVSMFFPDLFLNAEKINPTQIVLSFVSEFDGICVCLVHSFLILHGFMGIFDAVILMHMSDVDIFMHILYRVIFLHLFDAVISMHI